MNPLRLVTILMGCVLIGGCVESTFHLSRASALPRGLQTDDEAQRLARTASHIELWFYTHDPPTLKFFTGRDLVLLRRGSDSRVLDDDAFTVRFNGIDSTFRRVALPNVIAIEADPSPAASTQPRLAPPARPRSPSIPTTAQFQTTP